MIQNLIDKDLLDKVYKMYFNNRIRLNPICQVCQRYSAERDMELWAGPVPLYHIGTDFSNSDTRLLFVGLNAMNWTDVIGDWTIEKTEDYEMIQERVADRTKDLLFNEQRSYDNEGTVNFYNYLRHAIKAVHGDEVSGFCKIALTNFVHCNAGYIEDSYTHYKVVHKCASVHENGFLGKEIELLKPTHVVFCSTNKRKYMPYPESKFNSSYKFINLPHPSARPPHKLTIRQFADAVSDFCAM